MTGQEIFFSDPKKSEKMLIKNIKGRKIFELSIFRGRLVTTKVVRFKVRLFEYNYSKFYSNLYLVTKKVWVSGSPTFPKLVL